MEGIRFHSRHCPGPEHRGGGPGVDDEFHEAVHRAWPMEGIIIVQPGRIFLNLINFAFQMRGKAFKHLAAGVVLAIGLAMSAGCSKTEPEAVTPRHTINVHWALSPGGLGDMGYNDIIFAGISAAAKPARGVRAS